MSGVIIGQILEAGFLPHFCVLERHVSEDAALRAEIFWIELLMARGFALANCQAFAKPGDRKAKRKAETSRLADMQRLRAVANGRPRRMNYVFAVSLGHIWHSLPHVSTSQRQQCETVISFAGPGP